MYTLSQNQNAIHMLEQNIDKINWTVLNINPNAISLLVQNIDKIDWNTILNKPNIFYMNKPTKGAQC